MDNYRHADSAPDWEDQHYPHIATPEEDARKLVQETALAWTPVPISMDAPTIAEVEAAISDDPIYPCSREALLKSWTNVVRQNSRRQIGITQEKLTDLFYGTLKAILRSSWGKTRYGKAPELLGFAKQDKYVTEEHASGAIDALSTFAHVFALYAASFAKLIQRVEPKNRGQKPRLLQTQLTTRRYSVAIAVRNYIAPEVGRFRPPNLDILHGRECQIDESNGLLHTRESAVAWTSVIRAGSEHFSALQQSPAIGGEGPLLDQFFLLTEECVLVSIRDYVSQIASFTVDIKSGLYQSNAKRGVTQNEIDKTIAILDQWLPDIQRMFLASSTEEALKRATDLYFSTLKQYPALIEFAGGEPNANQENWGGNRTILGIESYKAVQNNIKTIFLELLKKEEITETDVFYIIQASATNAYRRALGVNGFAIEVEIPPKLAAKNHIGEELDIDKELDRLNKNRDEQINIHQNNSEKPCIREALSYLEDEVNVVAFEKMYGTYETMVAKSMLETWQISDDDDERERILDIARENIYLAYHNDGVPIDAISKDPETALDNICHLISEVIEIVGYTVDGLPIRQWFTKPRFPE
ncbi:hypothetical protein [Corynebacterium meridianum]|uniref:Uncharacterized protein n=1 Tax=Corynebacterium meridianum TaxID=2765363 RepID=A0A934HX37_9CORY|nr:hypothetical protein [Corynebacterium meridianum]MBI8988152.1 hypothetical protein [Corynebacterium meridianum]